MYPHRKPLVEIQKLYTDESSQRFFIGKLFFPFRIPLQLLIQSFDSIRRIDAGPDFLREVIDGVETLIGLKQGYDFQITSLDTDQEGFHCVFRFGLIRYPIDFLQFSQDFRFILRTYKPTDMNPIGLMA